VFRLVASSGDRSSVHIDGADAGEEGLGGLVGRVLRDELAAEGTLEDRRAERLRAALRTLDRRAIA
jgi:hypothetical protein